MLKMCEVSSSQRTQTSIGRRLTRLCTVARANGKPRASGKLWGPWYGQVKVATARQLQTVQSFDRRRSAAYNENVTTRETLSLPFILWGRYGFDGGKDSRDACRAPLTRKSGGTSVNCGYSVRSRRLISSERLPQ